MPKSKKALENEIKALRDDPNVRLKKLRNKIKSDCSLSFKNLGIVDDEKNFEIAERLLLSWFNYDKLEGFSQMMVQLFIEKYKKNFDLVIEKTPLWKTVNKNN